MSAWFMCANNEQKRHQEPASHSLLLFMLRQRPFRKYFYNRISFLRCLVHLRVIGLCKDAICSLYKYMSQPHKVLVGNLVYRGVHAIYYGTARTIVSRWDYHCVQSVRRLRYLWKHLDDIRGTRSPWSVRRSSSVEQTPSRPISKPA